MLHNLMLTALSIVMLLGSTALAQFGDKSADLKALPKVPPEFEVTLFASEPLVRQPCSMAFDEQGRLFVGMGPQYRNPTPETPGDSVVIVQDTDGDGRADRTQVFATGFNAIQGLAWHGRDLWIANAPDLTVVRDRDGDDDADEYVRLYTDLGNLEHGLHGLNWAPDGKLYMGADARTVVFGEIGLHMVVYERRPDPRATEAERGRSINLALSERGLDALRRIDLVDTPIVSAFFESWAPPPQMWIFGAVDFTAALAKVAKLLGYRVVVCDAREIFATRRRFPMADEVVVSWPGRLFDERGNTLTPRDAVCILTHDPKFDVPAVQGALASAAGYIGVMGSRKTHAKRLERLAVDGGLFRRELHGGGAWAGARAGGKRRRRREMRDCPHFRRRPRSQSPG